MPGQGIEGRIDKAHSVLKELTVQRGRHTKSAVTQMRRAPLEACQGAKDGTEAMPSLSDQV